MTVTTHRLNGSAKMSAIADRREPDSYFDDQAEFAAAFCALVDPSCHSKLPAAYEFHNKDIARLIDMARDIVRQGGQPDRMMAAILSRAQGDPDIGGLLAMVMEAETPAVNAPLLADTIRRNCRKRVVTMVAQKMLLAVEGGAVDLEPLVNEARAAFDDMERGAGVEPPRPISLEQLAADFPQLARAVIDGWLRAGETGNIIAAPKIGKSWMAYLIALTVATGGMLFGQFHCSRGRVLIIDNELFPSLIHHRIATVAKAAGISEEDYRGRIDVLSLRGRLLDIHGIAKILAEVAAGEYDLVILDALYRAEPEGQTENDNSARMRLYNLIDGITAKLGSAWINIHHASKGDQSSKSVTDVGAGAGSQSRAADTHIILRPHEEDGCIVLEAAVRSFAPVQPLALRWQFPLWLAADNLDPAMLKGRLSKAQERQRAADVSDSEKIIAALKDGPKSETKLRAHIGAGQPRTLKLLTALENENRIESGRKKLNGVKVRMYRLPKVAE